MDKEYIPYDLANELISLGFESQHRVYLPHEGMLEYILWQQAFRWFREKYGWIGGVRKLSSTGNNTIFGDFYKDDDNNFMMFGETYEDAELKSLKHLIEIAKNK